MHTYIHNILITPNITYQSDEKSSIKKSTIHKQTTIYVRELSETQIQNFYKQQFYCPTN